VPQPTDTSPLVGSFFTGSFFFIYTGDSGAGQLTNSVPFTITVVSSAVPEPTSMFLLGTGLAGVATKLRKRRKAILDQG